MKETIYEQLKGHRKDGPYPLHMPGHKRNTGKFQMENPYGIDITEIEGFDDLHAPEGILKEGMKRAADIFGSDECWYLVNGSTAGILAGIAACTQPGDRVLMARNCHKSVYHALILNQLEPVYLMPEELPGCSAMGSISPQAVEAALLEERRTPCTPPFSLVIVTSPTYEGVLSDIIRIAEICHAYGVPLFADEAHGAHLGFSPFPPGAIAGGADLTVQSLHKTLPAFTQTALLHRQGSLVEGSRVKHMLDIYQTSSPSYILIAGIDNCIRFLKDQPDFAEQWMEMLEEFYRAAESWSVLKLLPYEKTIRRDPSKLVISVAGSGHTGPELAEILRKDWNFEAEMAAPDYVIAMTGAGDRPEEIRRFSRALREIDRMWAAERLSRTEPGSWSGWVPQQAVPIWKADRMQGETVGWNSSVVGRTSLEFVFAYPPGIPLLAPGEVITQQVWQILEQYRDAGICLRGMRDLSGKHLKVL